MDCSKEIASRPGYTSYVRVLDTGMIPARSKDCMHTVRRDGSLQSISVGQSRGLSQRRSGFMSLQFFYILFKSSSRSPEVYSCYQNIQASPKPSSHTYHIHLKIYLHQYKPSIHPSWDSDALTVSTAKATTLPPPTQRSTRRLRRRQPQILSLYPSLPNDHNSLAAPTLSTPKVMTFPVLTLKSTTTAPAPPHQHFRGTTVVVPC